MKSSSFSKMFPKDYQPVPETDKTEGASQGSSKKVGDALRFMVADAQKRQENGKTEAPEKSSQSLGNTGDKATRNPQGETDRSTAVNTDKVDPSQSPETRSKSSLQDLTNHAYNLIMRFREQNPNPSLKDIEMYKFMTDKYNIGLKHLRKLGIPTDLKPIMPIKFLGGADTPDRMDLDGMNFGSTEEIRTSGVGSLPPSNHWNFIYEQYGLGAQDQGQQPGAQDQGWGARPVGERRRDARRANAEANAARWGIDPQGLSTQQISARVRSAMERNEQDEQE